MFYTYVIQGSDKRLYVGYSSDLKERIKKHFSRGVYTTKRMGNLKLIFYEAFISEKDAKRREKYFKTTKGKRTLKLMLVHSLGPVV